MTNLFEDCLTSRDSAAHHHAHEQLETQPQSRQRLNEKDGHLRTMGVAVFLWEIDGRDRTGEKKDGAAKRKIFVWVRRRISALSIKIGETMSLDRYHRVSGVSRATVASVHWGSGSVDCEALTRIVSPATNC